MMFLGAACSPLRSSSFSRSSPSSRPVRDLFWRPCLPLKKTNLWRPTSLRYFLFYTSLTNAIGSPYQSESTILITAPKQVEASRARDLSSEEASHRLSFLVEIVDSEGHAIKNASTTMKDEFYAEAYNTTDMFDANRNDNYNLNNIMVQQQQERAAEAVVNQMRNAIETSEYNYDNSIANGNMIQLPGQRVINPAPNLTAMTAILRFWRPCYYLRLRISSRHSTRPPWRYH